MENKRRKLKAENDGPPRQSAEKPGMSIDDHLFMKLLFQCPCLVTNKSQLVSMWSSRESEAPPSDDEGVDLDAPSPSRR